MGGASGLDRPVLDRLVGLLTVLAIAAAALFAYKFYKGDLTPGVEVRLRADRTGLLLDPGSQVSVRGVRVGTVREVTSEEGQAVILLSLEPEQAERLPANVVADLRPTTLFGAKYVDLVMPEQPAPATLREGDEIPQRRGTQEADEVFQNVMLLLDDVQPQKINNTLAAVSGALDGRGERLGQTVEKFNTYLVGILPSMDQLNRDLVLANRVLPTYQQAAPDLITAMDNWRTTSETLSSRSRQLTTVLTKVTETSGTTTALVIDAQQPLTQTVQALKGPTATLSRYSPMLTCLVEGLYNLSYDPSIARPMRYPGVWAETVLLPRARPYQYPIDLPRTAADTGPYCYGLPLVTSAPPHYAFDTGRDPYINGIPRR